MFHSSGHSKSRVKSSRRRMNYRVDCFAEDGGDDDDDDTDAPFFDPTDLSDQECCECDCTRSQTDNFDASRRDRPRRKASRRPSQVPCAVEPDSLPLARPIPLHYDAFDVAWHNKSRKALRHSGGEKYHENRGDGAVFTVGSKSKPSPSPAPLAPPPPDTLARLISQSVTRHSAVGIGAAAPSATTPRYYRRSTREASRRPSRLCLPVTSQPDPALTGRRPGMHGTRSLPLPSGAPASHKPPLAARVPSRHGVAKGAHVAEVKIPVQAHVSYVPRADDSPRSGSGACAGHARLRPHRPRGEIRIPLDVFASPYLACAVDAEQWNTQHLRKPSSQRVRRSQTKVQPTRSHVIAQPLLTEPGSAQPPLGNRPAAPLRKRHSEVGGAAKPRAASDKPPQKHRAPSVRSRASDTPLPHAVQSNLDALLSTYEAQLYAPRTQRRSNCTVPLAQPRPTAPEQATTARCLPRCATPAAPAVDPWGHRPDPRTIPPHLLSPRKPLSVRNREMLALIEKQLRAVTEPRTMGVAQAQPAQPVATRAGGAAGLGGVAGAESLAPDPQTAGAQNTAVGAQPTAQPPAQPPAQAQQGAPAAPAAPVASSAESRLSSLLTDLMNSGFDVAHLEAPTAKTEPSPTPTPPKSVEGSKLSPDPRGTYDALYNQQSLARVDFAEQIAACRVATPAELMKTTATKSGSRHKVDADADAGRDWQSGDELRRPRSKAASECANYASQDDVESVYENQEFWDSLDLNVDLNSVQSFSDGFEGHEDSYKYFRNGQIPSTTKRATSQTAMLGSESATGNQRRANHGSLHELWRHTERRPSRKPVAEPSAQPPTTSGYCNWADFPGKARNDGLQVERSREGSNDCRDNRCLASTPATSQTGDVATPDADVANARHIRVSKSFIAEVVEETLERREKSSASAEAACKRVASRDKMNVVQALDLIKQMSTAKNDALCMEIAKALNDRLIDCESAKSEQEYVTQLKKLRSDHLRHISREVKRLQDLEGFLDDFGHVRTLYDACAHAARQNGEE